MPSIHISVIKPSLCAFHNRDIRCAQSSCTGLHPRAWAVSLSDYRGRLQQGVPPATPVHCCPKGNAAAVLGTTEINPSQSDPM